MAFGDGVPVETQGGLAGVAAELLASAVVGGLALLCLPSALFAQSAILLRPVSHVATLAAGSIQGTVQDELGAPVSGAMVSAWVDKRSTPSMLM